MDRSMLRFWTKGKHGIKQKWSYQKHGHGALRWWTWGDCNCGCATHPVRNEWRRWEARAINPLLEEVKTTAWWTASNEALRSNTDQMKQSPASAVNWGHLLLWIRLRDLTKKKKERKRFGPSLVELSQRQNWPWLMKVSLVLSFLESWSGYAYRV